MDITDTLAPKSDQQGFDDYLTGPRTVTITAVHVVSGDQPVVVELAGFPGRPYKPNKSMRRVLAKAWGPESAVWVGRSLTLFGNQDVIWAGKAVGGVEISHMSHIAKPFKMPLTAKRGQKKDFSVAVLTAPVHRDWLAEADALNGDTAKLRAHWTEARDNGADEATLTAIQALATPKTDPAP